MKKNSIIAVLLAVLMILSFCACGKTESGSDTTEATEATEAAEGETEAGDTETTEAAEETTAAPVKNNVIEDKEMQISDKCEFCVDYSEITDDVMPLSPANFYSHYEADAGKVYVNICIAYKNTDTRNIDADDTVSATMIYDGKYEYTGFSMIEEDNRSDFTYSNITSIAPLSTEYVHYLFSVPEEVETSGKSIEIELTIDGKDYTYVVVDGEGAEASSEAEPEAAVSKTSGEVALKETVTTKKCEFCIDYSDITADVIPPAPDGAYSHYPADDGQLYVDICFAYKNLSDKAVGADDVISAKLTYDGKYEYTGSSMIEEDSRGDFTYSNITNIVPLSTEYVHYLFEVPEEVGNSDKSVVVNFTIDGNSYSYAVR